MHLNTHKHNFSACGQTHAHTHTSRRVLLASCLKYASFSVCVCVCLCVSRKVRGGGKQATEKGELGQERIGERGRESWATEQRCCEQLWHSQISPWLLSAGTWTLGLLGFGGQPRPHNPPSAPSSCLTPPWPRIEDRKIRTVPSQRDSFILPAGMLPVTRAYIMGNIAGPRRNSPCPHFSFSLPIDPPLSPPSSFSSSSFLFPLQSPLTPTFSILFLPLCTLPPLLFVIYLFGPTRLGTFITDSLDTILKPSHQQHNSTARTHWHAEKHKRTHVWACVCILWSIYSLCLLM